MPDMKTSMIYTALSLAVTLGGCAVGPNFAPPATPKAAGYGTIPNHTTSAAALDGEAQRFVQAMDIPGQW